MDANGQVIATDRDGRGVTVIEPGGYAAEVAALRRRFGDMPVIAAGMVGSTRGWCEVPYIAAPAGPADLATGLLRVEGAVAIVLGVSCLVEGRADVIRGEEVQVLGAVAGGLAPTDALFCQPGTHHK